MADYGFDQIQCQMPSMRELVLAVQKEHLARMYRLFNRIKNGLDPVALIFRKHVESEGMKIVNQAAEDATAKKEKDAGMAVCHGFKSSSPWACLHPAAVA